MDQHFLWNSMLLNPAEVQSMQSYITSPGERNISYTNMGNHNSAQSNMWSSGGPNYGHYSQSQDNHEETKVEHGPMSPLIIASSSALKTEESNYEVANSLESVNLNLNISQHGRQLLPENPSMHAVHQDPEYVADQGGLGNEFTASLYPYVLDFLDSDPSSIGSSHRCGTSYTSSESKQENDERPASFMDQRTACKRKNIETLLGQTSSTAKTNSYHPGQYNLQHFMSYSHNPVTCLSTHGTINLPSVSNTTEFYSPIYNPGSRRMFPDSYHSAYLTSNVENSHRNYRMRTNQTHLHGISASNLSLVDYGRHSNPLPPNQPSSRSIPVNPLEPASVFAASTSQSQPHIPVGPGVPQAIYPMHWNGAPSYNIENGLIPRREEANTRNIPVNSILVPTTDIGQMRHEPTNWTLDSREVIIAPPCMSRTHSSSVLDPSIGSAWDIYFPLQHPSQSLVSQELSRRGRVAPQSSHPAPHIRSTYMSDRQNDAILAVPLPLSIAVTRETTRRNMLETAALATTYLHERHRDMHLDVDNMSYEELLALGEYIGNVSTALNEEKISKCLKQRKFSSVVSGIYGY